MIWCHWHPAIYITQNKVENKSFKQQMNNNKPVIYECQFLRYLRWRFNCWGDSFGLVWSCRNGDQRAVGSRDPVDYLFKRQSEPAGNKLQTHPSLDNASVPPPVSSADYYPSKLLAEPNSFDSRRLYAQDDHQKMYVKLYCHLNKTPSVLWRCWLGGRKGIRPVKNGGMVEVGTG